MNGAAGGIRTHALSVDNRLH